MNQQNEDTNNQKKTNPINNENSTENLSQTLNTQATNDPQTINSNQHIQFPSTSKKTFAQIANQFMFPKKEQAVILSPIPNIPINEYILSLSKIIGPEKILFREKISNNRISVFLTSKQIVDELLNKHNHIIVQGQYIPIRRLISTAQRAIISGGSPIVPHDRIENEIKKMNFQLASNITFINAGMNTNNLNHIMSFKRQVYLNLTNENQLPASFLINYEDDDYRFFLDLPQQKCFSCNGFGHIAANCPENITNNQPNPIENPEVMDNDVVLSETEESETIEIEQTTGSENDENDEFATVKKKKERKRKRITTLSSQSAGSPEPTSTRPEKKNCD